MARADLLLNLVKFGLNGNRTMLRKVVEAVIAEERLKQHSILANRLEEELKNTSVEPVNYSNNYNINNNRSVNENRFENFITELEPAKKIGDLILPKTVLSICSQIVSEQHRTDLLRSYGLEPRNRILLIGPPGNGKTSLAEAIAESLMVPLYIVNYDSVIGAYLGETANRLRKLIDFVSTRRCVLFFDEFETLGKERGDIHETGEIKRVVSSFLMQIDDLPSHVTVIGATNHPELLDRAAWRRFQIRLNLPMPTRSNIELWFERFQEKHKIKFDYMPSTLAKAMYGANYAEIEEFGFSVLRQYVLSLPNGKMKDIVSTELNNWKSKESASNINILNQ